VRSPSGWTSQYAGFYGSCRPTTGIADALSRVSGSRLDAISEGERSLLALFASRQSQPENASRAMLA
jgi:hypothetical protein